MVYQNIISNNQSHINKLIDLELIMAIFNMTRDNIDNFECFINDIVSSNAFFEDLGIFKTIPMWTVDSILEKKPSKIKIM